MSEPITSDEHIRTVKRDGPPAPMSPFSRTELQQAASALIRSSVFLFVDLASTMVGLIKTPLALLLSLYIIAYAAGGFLESFKLTPRAFCLLPLVSRTQLCSSATKTKDLQGIRCVTLLLALSHCKTNSRLSLTFPGLVEQQGRVFETLLDEGLGNPDLAMSVKKAHIATSDLVTVVRACDLKSKSQLLDVLAIFLSDSNEANRNLLRLNARVLGAVDK
jgi:hypothetical protein